MRLGQKCHRQTPDLGFIDSDESDDHDAYRHKLINKDNYGGSRGKIDPHIHNKTLATTIDPPFQYSHQNSRTLNKKDELDVEDIVIAKSHLPEANQLFKIVTDRVKNVYSRNLIDIQLEDTPKGGQSTLEPYSTSDPNADTNNPVTQTQNNTNSLRRKENLGLTNANMGNNSNSISLKQYLESPALQLVYDRFGKGVNWVLGVHLFPIASIKQISQDQNLSLINVKMVNHLSSTKNSNIKDKKSKQYLFQVQDKSVSDFSRDRILSDDQNIYSNTQSEEIEFDSSFQCGNLSLVYKNTDASNQYILLLQHDTNTLGYSNWFYFKVSNKNNIGVYRFNIVNYAKAGYLYNHGAKVLAYSSNNAVKGWQRKGLNTSYQRNHFKVGNRSNRYTLGFTYNFETANDTVFFSYSIPYSYSYLNRFLTKVEHMNLPFFYRNLLTKSLVGNRVEQITLSTDIDRNTNSPVSSVHSKYSAQTIPHSTKPVVVILARMHPGETVGSWMLQGLMQQLFFSKSKQVTQFRNRYTIKILPMLNPDGVIHGNSRCSLAGRDLNRIWKAPQKQHFPEVYATKKMVFQLIQNRKVFMILDLHGHSKKKNIFMYGCQNIADDPTRCRQFPYLLSKLNTDFEYKSCNFRIEKYKESTARITFFRRLGIPNIFTIESSMVGNNLYHFSIDSLKKMGKTLVEAMCIYSNNFEGMQNIIKQLYENPELIETGNQSDSGSESEPSLDNVEMDLLQAAEASSRALNLTKLKRKSLGNPNQLREGGLSQTKSVFRASMTNNFTIDDRVPLTRTQSKPHNFLGAIDTGMQISRPRQPSSLKNNARTYRKLESSLQLRKTSASKMCAPPEIDEDKFFHNFVQCSKGDTSSAKKNTNSKVLQKGASVESNGFSSQDPIFKLRQFMRTVQGRRSLYKG